MRLPILVSVVLFAAGTSNLALAQFAYPNSGASSNRAVAQFAYPNANVASLRDTVPVRPADTALISADSTEDSIHRYVIRHDSKPWDYIMMKKGQLIEVTQGRQRPVNHDVTLVNLTTIHPDGTINDSDGKTKHLEEGKYITMDGKIRNLDQLPAGLPNH